MDFQHLMQNQMFTTSAGIIIALIAGWLLPNDKLYKMVRVGMDFIKLKTGKVLLKFISEKLGVVKKAADDEIAE
jgi:hypothetical protein